MAEATGNPSLIGAQQDVARMLAASGARLNYPDFEQNTRRFVDARGNYDVSGFIPRLADGWVKVEGSRRSVGESLVREVGHGGVQNLLSGLATTGRTRSTQLFSNIARSAENAGFPSALVTPVVQAAQSMVMDGLGVVTQELIGSAAAALGPLSGGLSIVGGGLLSMALGAFFGDKKRAPPPPPRVREILKPPPAPRATLAEVWLEIATATLRWRRDGLGRCGGDNCLLVPAGYTPATRRPPGQHYYYSAKEVGEQRLKPFTPSVQGTDWNWAGDPIPWTATGRTEYNFAYDALCKWVGYNPNLFLTVQEDLKQAFDRRELQSYMPYAGQIGWAEFIVGGLLGRHGLGPLRNLPDFVPTATRLSVLVANVFDGLRRVPSATRDLVELQKRHRQDPLAALGYVTLLVNKAGEVTLALAAQADEADRQTTAMKTDADIWQREVLVTIAANTSAAGRREIEEEQHRRDRAREEEEKRAKARQGVPGWAWALGGGLAAAGLAYGLTGGRRS